MPGAAGHRQRSNSESESDYDGGLGTEDKPLPPPAGGLDADLLQPLHRQQQRRFLPRAAAAAAAAASAAAATSAAAAAAAAAAVAVPEPVPPPPPPGHSGTFNIQVYRQVSARVEVCPACCAAAALQGVWALEPPSCVWPLTGPPPPRPPSPSCAARRVCVVLGLSRAASGGAARACQACPCGSTSDSSLYCLGG